MVKCNICITEECNGKHNCNCAKCTHISECYRYLHPTIRITNKCTQVCEHCCFNSNPKSKVFMTLAEAVNIRKFLINNEIGSINLMGGEFFCNPDWFEILDLLIGAVNYARLVTNGDWATNTDVLDKLDELIKVYGYKLRVSVSKDSWHTNTNVRKAEDWLKSKKCLYNISTSEYMTEDSIVPIGRGSLFFGTYSSFACYCHNPKNMYGFLIDEIGNIYKCSFGVWQYAIVEDYMNGGFAKRFKEFNQKFHSIFIPNCASCIRVASKEENNRVSLN